MYSNLYLTCKNYRYGISSSKGEVLLQNLYEEIYMPHPKALRIKYLGQWYEVEKLKENEINLPKEVEVIVHNGDKIKITKLFTDVALTASYSTISATDYLLKTVSSISVAYEQTIEELMLSRGTDSLVGLTNLTWVPKFPIVYIKKYYQNMANPNSGPLSDNKNKVKSQLLLK